MIAYRKTTINLGGYAHEDHHIAEPEYTKAEEEALSKLADIYHWGLDKDVIYQEDGEISWVTNHHLAFIARIVDGLLACNDGIVEIEEYNDGIKQSETKFVITVTPSYHS